MEDILEINFDYRDKGSDFQLDMQINYPNEDLMSKESQNQFNPLNSELNQRMLQMISEQTVLQQQIIKLQGDLLISEKEGIAKETEIKKYKKEAKQFQVILEEKTKTLDELSQELQEKITYLEATTQELEAANAEQEEKIQSLSSALEQKSSQFTKLQNAYKEREKRRSTAEVLLDQQEANNKDLIQKNVLLEKQVQDLEKKNNENNKIIIKLKSDVQSSDDVMGQRDGQVKKVLSKIKQQENDIFKLREDARKKDETIIQLNSTIQILQKAIDDNKQAPKERELKKALDKVSAKEGELKLMKEMALSWQKQHAKNTSSRAKKPVKLPPIAVQETSVIKSPAQQKLRFRENLKTKLAIKETTNSLESQALITTPGESETSPHQKLRKGTPGKTSSQLESQESAMNFGSDVGSSLRGFPEYEKIEIKSDASSALDIAFKSKPEDFYPTESPNFEKESNFDTYGSPEPDFKLGSNFNVENTFNSQKMDIEKIEPVYETGRPINSSRDEDRNIKKEEIETKDESPNLENRYEEEILESDRVNKFEQNIQMPPEDVQQVEISAEIQYQEIEKPQIQNEEIQQTENWGDVEEIDYFSRGEKSKEFEKFTEEPEKFTEKPEKFTEEPEKFNGESEKFIEVPIKSNIESTRPRNEPQESYIEPQDPNAEPQEPYIESQEDLQLEEPQESIRFESNQQQVLSPENEEIVELEGEEPIEGVDIEELEEDF